MSYIGGFYNFMQNLWSCLPAAVCGLVIAVFAFFILFGVLRMLFH